MSVDRLSNMVSSLKNTALSKKGWVEIYHSNECESVAKVLKAKGFIEDIKVFKPKGKAYKMLRIDLAKDESGEIKLLDAKRVSTPGHRIYASARQLRGVAGGYGSAIVSTSRGIMDSIDAKKKKLGGEVLCEVM